MNCQFLTLKIKRFVIEIYSLDISLTKTNRSENIESTIKCLPKYVTRIMSGSSNNKK